MKLETLALLVYIERLGTVSEAAKIVHLSQPAATSQIKQLEEELGTLIFCRKCRKNRLKFTPQGELVLGYAKQFRALEKKLRIDLSGEATVPRSITVGTGLTMGAYIVPYLVEGFKKKYPNIEITVKMMPGKDLVEHLDKADFQIAVSSINPSGHRLSATRFYDDEFCLVAPSEFEIPASITAQELQKYPLILREKNSVSRAILEKKLKKAGLTINNMNVVTEVFGNEAVKYAIETGNGVGFIPYSALGDFKKNKRYKIVKIADLTFSRPLYILCREETLKEPCIGDFIDFAVCGDWSLDLPSFRFPACREEADGGLISPAI